jgi:HK97 family phage prohead protease
MKSINKTLFQKIEYRTTENEGKRVIEAVIPYNSKSVDLGGFKEVITETAFTRTIKEGANVYAYYNHDDSKILGSTNAKTLELNSMDDGLYCRLHLGNTTWANDTWDVITRGDCNTLSFGFVPYEVENRSNLRYLKSVGLKEVSFCVSQPAYPETTSISILRKKKEQNMKNKKVITRSIDIEYLTEILSSGDLITDKEIAKELLSLIEPEVIKDLTAVENDAPADDAERTDTESDTDTSTEEKEDTEKEKLKQDLLDLIETLFAIEKEEEEETDESINK